MGEVRLLPGGSAPGHIPSPDVIRLLEDILEQARRGEVVSLGIVTVNPAGTYTTGWECANGTRFALFAGAHNLTNRLSSD